jgi:hypothetical protein
MTAFEMTTPAETELNAFKRNLRVRQAARDDLPFVAWCNYESSSPAPGFCYWDPLLGGLNTPTMAFIEAMFRADALAYGEVEDFFVVESDGQLIAGASGFAPDAADYRPLRLNRLPHIAEQLGWSAEQQAQFLDRYQGVWADPRDPSLAPRHRGSSSAWRCGPSIAAGAWRAYC